MANRYWVGGTANWDGTAGTKWALTSGGTGGQAAPTAADDVFFDANSTGTVTITTGAVAKSINCTGATSSLTLTGSTNITVSGSVTLVSAMGYSYTGRLTFNASATITTAGKTMGAFTVNGAGITVGLGDAYTFSTTAASINITQGTFNTNNYNITGISTNNNNIFNISGTSTRTVNLGSSTLTFAVSSVLGAIWNASTTINLTFNAGTSSLVFTGQGTFEGGDLTYNNLTFNNNTTRTINGANTFNTVTLSGTTSIAGNNTITTLANGASPATFTFTAGTTTTLTNWNVSGTAGNLVTIQSATAASHTLSKASGTVSADYLSISRSTATGGATWYAGANSTDGGNNSGWIFAAAPAITNTNFLVMF
jgi:hypothetical protein